jgi:hypothetical protein
VVKIEKPVPTNPSLSDLVSHWAGIRLTFDLKIPSRKQRFRSLHRRQSEEALQALIASARLVEQRHQFICQVNYSITDPNFY